MKKKICIISTILILAILIATVFLVNRNQFSLEIDGYKIDKEEFLDAADRKKYDVTSYFTQKNGVNVDSEFWEREIDGELPYKKLAEEAIEELKYFHAVYGLAEEKGYVEDGSYAALLGRWESENQARKEKIENGETVYGLSEYTLELYLEYEMDTIQKSYCDDLENEGMEITDADRAEYYAEHIDYYYRDDDRVLDYIKIPYLEQGLSDDTVRELKECLTRIYKQMDAEHSLKELAGSEEKLAEYLEHADVTASELVMYSRTIDDILEYAWELQAGESTAVLDEEGSLYLIECTDRTENDTTPIEEVRDNINKTLREENYDKILTERAAAAKVEGDMEQIFRFMKKNIGNEK